MSCDYLRAYLYPYQGGRFPGCRHGGAGVAVECFAGAMARFTVAPYQSHTRGRIQPMDKQKFRFLPAPMVRLKLNSCWNKTSFGYIRSKWPSCLVETALSSRATSAMCSRKVS